MIGKSLIGRRTEVQDPTIFKPQLTSLIDVMTFLLVFLVKNFSVEGTVITPADDLQLPISTSEKNPRAALMLEITGRAVLWEGRTLARVDDIRASDSLLVPGVYALMVKEHAKYAESVKNFEALIQADREIEYEILKKVMYSCSKAGYTDFTILTLQKG